MPWTEPPVHRARRGRLFSAIVPMLALEQRISPPTFSQPINLSRSFYL
jgi:hypothetical protein